MTVYVERKTGGYITANFSPTSGSGEFMRTTISESSVNFDVKMPIYTLSFFSPLFSAAVFSI